MVCTSLAVKQPGTCSVNLGQKGSVAPGCLRWEKYGLSGVTSSPTLAKVFFNKRQCTLSCPVACNPGTMKNQKHPAERLSCYPIYNTAFCSSLVLGRQPCALLSLWLRAMVRLSLTTFAKQFQPC